MKYLFYGVLSVMLVEVMFYLSWVYSGQFPADGFYLGRITNEIISLFI